MNQSVYTLLIVESPVLASVIQEVAPQSIYAIATGGYCWHPQYNAEKNSLTPKADPDKIDIRRELKEQAQWANNVIIATDSDPSGDFIAWSVAKFLKRSAIRRGQIQSLSKTGIIQMLEDVREVDISFLESRLKNLFLIQSEWNKEKSLPQKELAGLVSLFGASGNFIHFLDENNHLYRSSSPVFCEPDELIPLKRSPEKQFRITEPLSTFDLLEKNSEKSITAGYNEAQVLLQRLFQTILPNSGKSLISYPRSSANSFYGQTWENFRVQFLSASLTGELKPNFLQETASIEEPHESIYPLNLGVTPEIVSGELLKSLADLYKLIYSHTLEAIKIPEMLNSSFENDLKPEVYFYPEGDAESESNNRTLRPCITVGDLGRRLFDLGIARPSNFGEKLDSWIEKKWISSDKNVVTALQPVKTLGNRSADLQRILVDLKSLEDRISLSPETVRGILTS
ncbi:MAG: hypothetical protein JJU37_13805 [Balneolaceae bacterium]|nr:hypothetical protein [Balneolaceae bacterium]